MTKLFLIVFIILATMGNNIIPEIRDKYNFYNELLKERKSILTAVIGISEVKLNKKNFLINNTQIKHIRLSDKIVLIAEVKTDNYKYFQFKLRCDILSNTPFFRFDSDGGTHRNYDNENIPIHEQLITTPHFHCFDQDGRSIAYKTDKLLNDAEKRALEDISLCISHFCHESNIRLNKDDFPTVSILPGTLQLDAVNDDPNKGVEFV